MPSNAVILIIDRLHSGFVGACGNTWIATPELNRLAADGFLFDRAMIDSPGLEQLYRSYWQGIHALAQKADNPSASLPRDLVVAGYTTVLLTDDPAVAQHPLAAGFGEYELLEMPALTPAPAGLRWPVPPGCANGQRESASGVRRTQSTTHSWPDSSRWPPSDWRR